MQKAAIKFGDDGITGNRKAFTFLFNKAKVWQAVLQKSKARFQSYVSKPFWRWCFPLSLLFSDFEKCAFCFHYFLKKCWLPTFYFARYSPACVSTSITQRLRVSVTTQMAIATQRSTPQLNNTPPQPNTTALT